MHLRSTPQRLPERGGGLRAHGVELPSHPAGESRLRIGARCPDLSTDADPDSGYLLYAPWFTQEGDPALEGGWGGTSFVGPDLNGSTAVIDSSLSHGVGLWNPSIYSFATGRTRRSRR
jgi:kumamolisin